MESINLYLPLPGLTPKLYMADSMLSELCEPAQISDPEWQLSPP